MADVKYIKMETQSQRTFREFLNGVSLPSSACQAVMNDLSGGQRYDDYDSIVAVVKKRLHSESIVRRGQVLFVNFVYVKKEQERPVLTRILNILFGSSCFIVVNMEEVLYLPEGCKNNQSANELAEWLTTTAEEYLAAVDKKKLVDYIKEMFGLKRTSVKLSFV